MTSDLFHGKMRDAREHLISRRFGQAVACYDQLTRLSPRNGVVWMEYGNAASGCRQYDRAEQAWNRALELEPGNYLLAASIGAQFEGLRQSDKARACFQKAVAADPRAIDPRINLAVLLEKNHRLDESRAVIEECLAISPRDDQARYLAAVLDRREGKFEEAERRLRELIASRPAHLFVCSACHVELAHVLDRSGRCDEAFRELEEAKKIARSRTDARRLEEAYEKEAEIGRRLALDSPNDCLRRWARSFPEKKREPIPRLAFLGGHPRSGTTLLEEILGAHPAVAALDEPLAFLELLQPELARTEGLTGPRLNVLRRNFIAALEWELGGKANGRLLLDKNPSPTAQLPVWLRVFPELRVVIALRDPRDVVLSCYFLHLPLNNVSVNFLGLDRLVRHYANLMDVWLAVREWEGFAGIETRYEDMVAETRREGSRITEFLGLDWRADQERFYERSRAKQLNSPTYRDVTQPVYTKSVGRWRAYEEHLAPIMHILKPYCERFGYS
jgi:tetratricopeptide (TPR) repeat protein